MKNLIVFLLLVFSLTACKKAIEAAQEDLIVKAMTDGQWRVTKFEKGGTDVTTGFSPYKFQFYANNSVQAINNGSIESTGNWSGNAAGRTIASNFTNASATLMLLNGTWQVTKNSWTFVEANQTVNNEVLTLRLDK